MAATITFQPMFAEISDKMPTVGGLWGLSLFGPVLVFVLYRVSKITLLVSLPLAGFWLVGIQREFFGDAYFKSAVISEMDWSYLRHVSITAALPLFAAIICGILFLRFRRSIAVNI